MYRQSWVDVFITYNTSLPSPAAVERSFSMGAAILTAIRASLTSRNFLRLVFLKENLGFLNGKGYHKTTLMACPVGLRLEN